MIMSDGDQGVYIQLLHGLKGEIRILRRVRCWIYWRISCICSWLQTLLLICRLRLIYRRAYTAKRILRLRCWLELELELRLGRLFLPFL